MEILYTKDGTPRYVVKSYSSDELTKEIKELIDHYQDNNDVKFVNTEYLKLTNNMIVDYAEDKSENYESSYSYYLENINDDYVSDILQMLFPELKVFGLIMYKYKQHYDFNNMIKDPIAKNLLSVIRNYKGKLHLPQYTHTEKSDKYFLLKSIFDDDVVISNIKLLMS